MRKAVFLDRDGVINEAAVRDGRPYPPALLSELKIPPGVQEALSLLKRAGYLLIVVTNQPDVARGTASKLDVEAINSYLQQMFALDAVYVCYHDDIENCTCRKPKPGALFEASDTYDIDLEKSFMIGDRWRDIDAGMAAGCCTIFVDNGYIEKKPNKPDHKVGGLLEAVSIILESDYD